MTGTTAMERRRYRGARIRVYGPALLAFLAVSLPVVGLVLHYLGLGIADIAAGPPFELTVESPPWYAYLALFPMLAVPGAVIAYRVSRLPCPQCGSAAAQAREGAQTWEVMCSPCRVVWVTNIGVSRGGSGQPNHDPTPPHHFP